MKFDLFPRNRKGIRHFRAILSVACLSVAATESKAQNPAATYVWQGGNQLWSTPVNWGTADVPNSADVAAKIDGGKASLTSLVSVNGSFTVGALAIDAGDGIFITEGSSLTVDGSSLFTGAGTLANSGGITFEGLTYGSTLTLGGSVTLSGGGTITLIPRSQIGGDNSTLTNVDNTIAGYSGGMGVDGIEANNLTIINQAAGVINANVSGEYFTVSPRGGTVTNAGLLEATNGGILDLDGSFGATFNNVAAGTMQAQDGSVLLVRGSGVTGGTLSTSGSGLIQIDRGGQDAGFTNVTSTGSLFVDGTVDLTGTFTNSGSVTFGGNGGNGGITINTLGNVTLNGAGLITMTSGSQITGNGGTLTNTGNTIQGFGNLGNNQIGIANGAAGVINANISGLTLTVDPAVGGLTNAGLMEAGAGGTLFLSGNFGQPFTNRSEFRVNDSGTINASRGIITNLVNGTLTGGTYRVFSTTTAATTLSFGGDNITTNAATVVLSGVNSVFADLGTLSDNRGSLSLLGLREFTTVGALSNEGTLVFGAGSTLHTSGALTASGTSILAFTVGGTSTQGAQSPGVLQVSGAAAVSGNLTVSFATGATLPGNGDTLTILSAAQPVSGSFANVASGSRLVTTDGRGSFRVNYGTGTNTVVLSDFLLPGQMDALPTVTLSALVPSVTANSGQEGEFLLTLSSAPSSDVVVNFTIKGSAVNGTDYVLLNATKKIKAGKTSKPIKVIPQGDLDGASKKTVVLTLAPGNGYQIGTAGKVKVKIISQ